MKKFRPEILCLALLLLVMTSPDVFSTILTVSNNSAISAQYSSITAAINAANSGDTLYVHGSGTSYGDVTLRKRLVIIGPGYYPADPSGVPAQFGSFYLDTLNGVSGASGSYFSGLTMNSFNSLSGYSGKITNNITIKRCKINNSCYIGYSNTEVHNWILSESLIYNVSYSTNNSLSSGILINNCVMSYSSNVYRTIFTNNVVYNVPNFSECNVSNCIFISSAGNNSSVFSTFDNNLFSSAINFTNANNTFAPANQATTNSDPQFAGGTATGYLTINDYHLQSGSAGHNAGTDGKDLGVYGGPGIIWGGAPPVPTVYLYSLKPNYVQSNGTLNITIGVKNQ
ncbi:MAG: hypothetical protein U0T82_16475 [Bacteroidales bacterium]